MNKVINDEKIPIKLWVDDIDQGTLQQARNLANFPFAFKHISIMPDTHQGYGMPIGGILASKGVIIPNAVGVDIGCGMSAVKMSCTDIEQEKIKKILGKIRTVIPVGFSHHESSQDNRLMPGIEGYMPVVEREYKSALKQLGTLGGGNHFIEIQKGRDGHVWLMVHSGSRNIGKQVADYYNKLAINLMNKYKIIVPKEWQLAYLFYDSDEGKMYFREMNFCITFAYKSRLLMINNIMNIFKEEFKNIEFQNVINIAHNFASVEIHYNEEVIVHRKGATQAFAGQIGIIPGSQGSKSFIIKGKGNQESFMSCSHGAGRKLGRKQAIRELDFEYEKNKLDKMGIIHSIRGVKDLDEAAGAYKDIDEVMKNQEDLVEILVELTPMAVIKG